MEELVMVMRVLFMMMAMVERVHVYSLNHLGGIV